MSLVLEIKDPVLHHIFVREEFIKLLQTLIEGSWPGLRLIRVRLVTTSPPPLSTSHLNITAKVKLKYMKIFSGLKLTIHSAFSSILA